ncbi:MAG: acyl-CoA desaturase [Deltaproteobacteria bacterium]|nr:acyl-CoA desaturase [Deltaproteobacteria bacterium]
MSGLPVNLSDSQIAEFGRQMDRIKYEVTRSLGDDDARYIRRLIKIQRLMLVAGRLMIYASLPFLPMAGLAVGSWVVFASVISLGIVALAVAKILENMEIGHNILHAQWDWMRDPQINSTTWEWDTHCVAEHWKQTHNVVHHTWTNVLGKDHDVGYGFLRVDAAQPWRPRHLIQPFFNVVLMVFFEWLLSMQSWRIEDVAEGRTTLAQMRPTIRTTLRKMLRQGLKDYVLFPLLAGPFFPVVAAANFVATVMRSIWSNMVIFCGHFPTGSYLFTEEQVENETRAEWYMRQMLGSSNFSGGRLMTIISGSLNYQIEHHLFPDMPSNRYPQVAPQVRALAAEYGLPYNTGTLLGQYWKTTAKIWRLALPGQAAPTEIRKQVSKAA